MKHMHIEKKIKKHEEKGESSISILLNSEHIETRNIKHLLPGRGKRASLEAILHLSCSRIEAEKHELILRGYLSAAGGFSPRPIIRSRISAGGIHGLRNSQHFAACLDYPSPTYCKILDQLDSTGLVGWNKITLGGIVRYLPSLGQLGARPRKISQCVSEFDFSVLFFAPSLTCKRRRQLYLGI